MLQVLHFPLVATLLTAAIMYVAFLELEHKNPLTHLSIHQKTPIINATYPHNLLKQLLL